MRKIVKSWVATSLDLVELKPYILKDCIIIGFELWFWEMLTQARLCFMLTAVLYTWGCHMFYGLMYMTAVNIFLWVPVWNFLKMDLEPSGLLYAHYEKNIKKPHYVHNWIINHFLSETMICALLCCGCVCIVT